MAEGGSVNVRALPACWMERMATGGVYPVGEGGPANGRQAEATGGERDG